MRSDEVRNRGRRLLRLSLRGLLLSVALVCAFLGVEARRLNRQRAAVAWVERHGGVALYGWQLDERRQWTEAHPPYPRWLMRMLGPDCFQSIEAVDIFNARLDDITPLAELTELENLELNGNWISDLRPISQLHELRVLHLADNRIVDLRPLAELTGLETLVINRNQVRSLEGLRGMSSLRTLIASENQISDLGPLSELARLQYTTRSEFGRLRYVDVRENPLSEGDVVGLRGIVSDVVVKADAKERVER